MTDSIAICHDETGRVYCKYGDISESSVTDGNFGVITGMGPLMVVTLPLEQETFNLGSFGVKFSVTAGIAKTEAKNGTWFHRLEPAHWADGVKPDSFWSDNIMLGRWPD